MSPIIVRQYTTVAEMRAAYAKIRHDLQREDKSCKQGIPSESVAPAGTGGKSAASPSSVGGLRLPGSVSQPAGFTPGSAQRMPSSSETAGSWHGRHWSMPRIKLTVARIFGLSISDLNENIRVDPHFRARHIAIALARRLTGRSDVKVGRVFRRDHTSILYIRRKYERVLDEIATTLPADASIEDWVVAFDRRFDEVSHWKRTA
jgi:hypothetical protein